MTVYAVTYKDCISKHITPGKRYKVMEERHPCFDIEFDNGTRQTGRWDKCAHLGWNEGWIRIDTNSAPVTLAPGDYVSTAGMTEDQYHAVARAFMTAGAGSGEYPAWEFADEEMNSYGPGWSFGNNDGDMWHGLAGEFDGRHLTISQALNATNAGNKEEDMTPCERLGYKVGDVFEYTGDGVFPRGGRIRLSEDDGTNLPMFHGIDCNAYDGDNWAYARIGDVKRIDGTTEPLTTTLQSAREEADKASEHEAKADQHRAKYDELMQQARDMLPDGWRLVRDGEHDSDMDDPANWREGDVVEVLKDGAGGYSFEEGEKHRIGIDGAGDVVVGPSRLFFTERECRTQLKWHHRPT